MGTNEREKVMIGGGEGLVPNSCAANLHRRVRMISSSVVRWFKDVQEAGVFHLIE